MTRILNYEKSKDSYLIKTRQIDVKEESELMNEICERLKTAIEENKKINYLTANQVGRDRSVILLRADNGDLLYLVNPLMIACGKPTLARESELHVASEYLMLRNDAIKVIFYDPMEERVNKLDFTGIPAMLLQHAQNNLDGISIQDFGLELDELYDQATDSERQELHVAYLNALKDMAEKVDEAALEDSEISRTYTAYKFSEAVVRGEVEYEGKDKKKKNRKQRRKEGKILRKFFKHLLHKYKDYEDSEG